MKNKSSGIFTDSKRLYSSLNTATIIIIASATTIITGDDNLMQI